MQYSLEAFQEPRGVMRILQFIFAIVAFATTTNFSAEIITNCNSTVTTTSIDYPFHFEKNVCPSILTKPDGLISADVSSDAQFFVATGILSMLYCMFIVVVYAVLNELYRSKSEIPLADFFLTTTLAIFWLSGSAAWSNGTSGLKTATDLSVIQKVCAPCQITVASFSKLNISLIIGFLNFFLWASDLWFLYKETIWFQGRQQQAAGQPSSSMGPSV